MHNPLALFERLTILYAEDEESLRKSVAQTLELFFDNVIEAKDGEEALDKFQTNRVDIIITDFYMPNKHSTK